MMINLRFPKRPYYSILLSFFITAFALSICLPSAVASNAKKVKVDVDILRIKLNDPQACQKLKDFLKTKKIEVPPKKLKQLLAHAACDNDIGLHNPTAEPVETLVFLKDQTSQKSSSDSKNAMHITLDAQGGVEHGNSNFDEIKGTFHFDKRWNDKQVVTTDIVGDYRSDQISQATFTAYSDYFYMFAKHWAVFAAVLFNHDGPKEIEYGTEQVAGFLYDVFPFSAGKNHTLSFSAGPGYRFESYPDKSNSNTILMSYRAKLQYDITKRIQLMTQLWFQHVLYAIRRDGSHEGFNLADYRVLLQFTMRVFLHSKDHGWNILSSVQDEYFSNPPIAVSTNNDITGNFGVGYVW